MTTNTVKKIVVTNLNRMMKQFKLPLVLSPFAVSNARDDKSSRVSRLHLICKVKSVPWQELPRSQSCTLPAQLLQASKKC